MGELQDIARLEDDRFLMNTVVEDTVPSPITIVLNWDALLRQ